MDIEHTKKIHYHAKQNNIEVLRQLLAVDPNLNPSIINQRDNNNKTLLIFACENKYNQVVELLLRNGADPNIKSASGKIALNYAIENNNKEIISLLLASDIDIDINIINRFGYSMLMLSVIYKDTQCIELLLKHNINATGYKQDDKVNIDFLNEEGDSALMMAALQCNKVIVELLLSYNAEITEKQYRKIKFNIIGVDASDIKEMLYTYSRQHRLVKSARKLAK